MWHRNGWRQVCMMYVIGESPGITISRPCDVHCLHTCVQAGVCWSAACMGSLTTVPLGVVVPIVMDQGRQVEVENWEGRGREEDLV